MIEYSATGHKVHKKMESSSGSVFLPFWKAVGLILVIKILWDCLTNVLKIKTK